MHENKIWWNADSEISITSRSPDINSPVNLETLQDRREQTDGHI